MNAIRKSLVGLSAFVLAQLGSAASLTVNTATDDFGVVPTNCSLREAIQSANGNADFGGCVSTGIYGDAITDVINLPTLGAGSAFTLTRIGTDDSNVAGDLDINGLVRIAGVSAANSVIRGDTNDADSDRNRLIHVIGGTATLNDLTLRDGLEDGQSAGGGLRSEPGSTTVLNRVLVANNIAGGNAGGILNRGTMTINSSTIRNNLTRDATIGGGGIFNSPNATLTLNDSQVLDNVTGNADLAFGGGIYNDLDASLTLDNSVVDGNGAIEQSILNVAPANGGGIFTRGPTTLIQSSITSNVARGLNASGGGIEFDDVPEGLLDRCVVSFNQAHDPNDTNGSTEGGGLHNFPTAGGEHVEVRDSVISGNVADSSLLSVGGGLFGEFRIVRSTVANNQVLGIGAGSLNISRGGGFHALRDSEIVNSTFLGNSSTELGGAISFNNASQLVLSIRGSTIAGNSASEQGGGIHVEQGNLLMANTVLADNTAGVSGPDCAGILDSDGFNLVQNDNDCAFLGGVTDQVDVSAGLAPIANNGGPTAGSSLGTISAMQTRSPLADSPLVDAGPPDGCRDNVGALLPTDQVGRPRALDGGTFDGPATCDIGAVELLDTIFVDGFDD